MKIPLANRLKKRVHIDTGLLQDEIVDLVYSMENNAVLHGGTAIWRCYEGNRFSEDLDFYFPVRTDFEKELRARLAGRSLELIKYKKTQNVAFIKISDGQVEVRLEINFISKKIVSVVRSFEKIDGSLLDIFTLSVEDLLIEKMHAYQSRKLIRDIYDIYHLSKHIQDGQTVKPQLTAFLSALAKPLDEENLKALLYTGAVPSFAQMTEILKSRFST